MKRKGIIAILDALLAYTTMFVFVGAIVLLLSNQDYESGRESHVLNYWAEDIAEAMGRSWVAYDRDSDDPDPKIKGPNPRVYDGLYGKIPDPGTAAESDDEDGYWHDEMYLPFRCDTSPHIQTKFLTQLENLAIADGFYVKLTITDPNTNDILNEVYGRSLDGMDIDERAEFFDNLVNKASAIRYLLEDRDMSAGSQPHGSLTGELCKLTVIVAFHDTIEAIP
ncbi:MAG: hypothetical protein JXB14_06110 [Candidatus Altiarchaeota archaeon]|nr:hypothetical protein [Candidatus Altiarchaeota archaeon]